MRFTRNSTKWMLILGLPALLVLASGCGLDRSPVSQEEEVLAPAPEGRMLLAFSPQAALRAAKKVKNAATPEDGVATATVTTSVDAETSAEPTDLRTATQTIGSSGGKLTVEDCSGGKNSDILADFIVPKGALEQDAKITMTVHGEVLSEMVVEFGPAGLTFDPNARLELVLGLDLVDIDNATLQLWHIHGDGTVEEAAVEGIKVSGKRKMTLIVDIPGFSRYGVARY